MKNAVVIDNPFVANALGYLRDRNTKTAKYRFYSDQLCQILLSESLRGLELENETIQTPLVDMGVKRIEADIVIVPIFRAGLAMLQPALQLLPSAKVGFVGLARDEKTAIAKEYYWKFPEITKETVVVITDPMLATGGSLLHVLRRLKEMSPREIRVASVISAPEGLEAVEKEFPDVKIFTAAIDERLNDQKFIVPGLGDYGDRYFGTE